MSQPALAPSTTFLTGCEQSINEEEFQPRTNATDLTQRLYEETYMLLEKKSRKSKIFFSNEQQRRIPVKSEIKTETLEERDARYPPWIKPVVIDNKLIKLVDNYNFESSLLPRLPKANVVVDSLLALVCARVGVNVKEAQMKKIEEEIHLN
jgi:hypothetical protein